MVAVKLFKYQEEAIEKLKTGSILCGGVGSGKSITAIAYYFCKVCHGSINGLSYGYSEDYVPMKSPKNLIIITTARKRDLCEWDTELNKFHINKDKTLSLYDIDVFIDSWNNIGKYTGIKNSFFIFDEQRVVGYGAWTKSFLKITKSNDWILLSATPGDKWEDYIPVFIANGFYKNKTEFMNEHAVVYYKGNGANKYPTIDHYVNQGKLIKYRNSILINMDYFRVVNYHNEIVNVSYDKKAYKSLRVNRWNPYEDAPITNSSEFCFLLRKVVNSDKSRMDALKKIVNDKKKVIVFYNHDYERDILLSKKYFSEGEEALVAEWSGHKHELIPNSNCWVYIVNYSSGSEGWNCIETDTIVFYSLSYSYRTMIQAAGRIDRLNSPFSDLYYYKFKSSADIDLAISRALNQKKNFNEKAFSQL